MADPYAVRSPAALEIERPPSGGRLPELVAGRGGLGVVDLTAAAGLTPGDSGATFWAVLVADDGLLPPLARIEAPIAVALLAAGSGESAELAQRAAERLRAAPGPLLLLKEGLVAGPAGAPGCFATDPGLSESLIASVLAGRVEWERDPDFGYDVAARVPGVDGAAADALCPRLLYAAADRVYEHADLVVEYKCRRHERLAAIEGIAPELLAAGGWPIEPTGQTWKEE